MAEEQTNWPTGGRGLRWRLGMILGGALLCGYAIALIYWPVLLGWTLAAGFAGLGALFVASGFLARGPR
jgi:hypothetical protein